MVQRSEGDVDGLYKANVADRRETKMLTQMKTIQGGSRQHVDMIYGGSLRVRIHSTYSFRDFE